MANAAFAFNNLADAATITGSSAAVLAPFTRLQNKHVMRKWVGKNGTTEYITVDLGTSLAWDTLALFGLNFNSSGVTRVRASNVDASGQSGEVYDSGSAASRVDGNYKSLIILRGTSTASRYTRIDLSQSGVASVKAGRLLISMRTPVGINFSTNWSRGWTDATRRTDGVSGQVFDDVLDTYRTVEATFQALSLAEKNGFVETIGRDLGSHGDFLFIEDPDSDNLGRDCLWGFVDEATSAVTGQNFYVDGDLGFSVTYRLRQRL